MMKKSKINKNKVICHRCGKTGHYANECGQNTATSNVTSEPQIQGHGSSDVMTQTNSPNRFQFCQIGIEPQGINLNTSTMRDPIPKNWILLDNKSTIDVFCNPDPLDNIRESKIHMDIHCTAGNTTTKMIGDLKGYGTVWYHST